MLRFPSGFNERVDIAKIQPNYRTKIEKVTLLALIYLRCIISRRSCTCTVSIETNLLNFLFSSPIHSVVVDAHTSLTLS